MDAGDGIDGATVAQLQAEAEAALALAGGDAAALEAWQAAWLGKAGRISALLRQVGSLPAAERPAFGAAVNAAHRALEAAHAAAAEAAAGAARATALAAEAIDVTLPGTAPARGRLHPSTVILRRMCAVFGEMGFQVHLSREVEHDDFNFTLLNHPLHHPARDAQDTFYVAGSDEQVMLRTHTSPGQIHAMRASCPDVVRIVLPGMVYRNEKITPRSEIQFTQVEGLAIGPRITMANLRGTIDGFVHRYFGPERRTRFRASYFPFTEPSAEVDVSCALCDGAGCRLCKGAGWLEILGCGMVHPTVLRNGGYDPDAVSGFAFGLGPMRTQMSAHGIDDIRHYWSNDLRFLAQFG